MTFRLRTLLVGIGLLGVVLFLLFVAPGSVATILLIFAWVTLAAALTAGITSGRGNTRAFCVEAMFPVGATVIALTWILLAWLAGGFDNRRDFRQLFEDLDKAAFSFRVWSASGWIMTLVCGAACAIGRRVLTPKQTETDKSGSS